MTEQPFTPAEQEWLDANAASVPISAVPTVAAVLRGARQADKAS